MTTATTTTRQDRAALFANLASAETQPRFWAHVSDEVDWSVMGTHPLAGRYIGKQQFIEATFSRLTGVLQGGAKLEVLNILVDGDTVVAELASTSVSNEGAPFDNKYCWVCRFDGDTIVEVRAYLDSTMVMYTVLRNELIAGQKPAAA